MSRFSDDYDGEGMPWGLWENVVSSALGGRRGQEALAAMEDALLALPERKLIKGHLAHEGGVCAIGAYVAHRRAKREGVDLATVIDAMGAGVKCWCGHSRESHTGGGCTGRWTTRPCTCEKYAPDGTEYADETASAGHKEGLAYAVAWHLAYLNDESFEVASPERRFELMLTWVRRAQGKHSFPEPLAAEANPRDGTATKGSSERGYHGGEPGRSLGDHLRCRLPTEPRSLGSSAERRRDTNGGAW